MRRFAVLLLLFSVFVHVYGKQNDAQKVKKWADHYAEYYRLDNYLVYYVIEAESAWLHYGTDTLHYVAHKQIGDHKHSFGPMQIKLPVAHELWPNKTVSRYRLLYDIQLNISTGCKLLVQEFEYFRDRTSSTRNAWLLTLTSYNRGRFAAKKTMTCNKYALKIYNKWKGKNNVRR